jgi:hypothetical protein
MNTHQHKMVMRTANLLILALLLILVSAPSSAAPRPADPAKDAGR